MLAQNLNFKNAFVYKTWKLAFHGNNPFWAWYAVELHGMIQVTFKSTWTHPRTMCGIQPPYLSHFMLTFQLIISCAVLWGFIRRWPLNAGHYMSMLSLYSGHTMSGHNSSLSAHPFWLYVNVLSHLSLALMWAIKTCTCSYMYIPPTRLIY